MKLEKFEAYCPLEVGDRVLVKKAEDENGTGDLFRIEPETNLHKAFKEIDGLLDYEEVEDILLLHTTVRNVTGFMYKLKGTEAYRTYNVHVMNDEKMDLIRRHKNERI